MVDVFQKHLILSKIIPTFNEMKKLLPLLLLILIGCSENQEKWIGTSGDLVERNGKVYEKDYGITKQSFVLTPYTGKYKQKHFNYIEEGNVINSTKTGKFIHSDYDGNLKIEGFYNSLGVKHGYFTYYYKTGEIEMEGKYEHGVQEGMWGIFYRNGQKKGELIYENGVEQTSLILKSLDSIY